MKKLILLVLISTIVIIKLFSQNVSYNDAFKVAENKLTLMGKHYSHGVLSDVINPPGKNGQNLFFVFELEPVGYIVVTGRKDLPPVIAYSFEDNFQDETNSQNPLMDLLVMDIEARVSSTDKMGKEIIERNKLEWKNLLSDNPEKNVLFEQWPPEGTTTTGGWLETNWTQNAPYKNFCPIDPVTSQRSYVGCPATAMAQIVNYFKTTNETQFSDADDYYHSYAGRNYWIDDDFEEHDFLSFPKINEYLDSIAGKYEIAHPLTNDEKAALSFACGVAANQVYTSEGSGTFGVSQAHDAYMKFGFAEAVLIDDGDTSLYATISQNMMDARPCHFAIVNESWTVGHNVVLDGYNTDEYYHLNFGWGGASNGWYLVPDDNMPYELSVIEGVVVDIAYPPVFTGFSNDMKSTGANIHIYPNPAINFITVVTDMKKGESVEINIKDSFGRIIYIDRRNATQVNGRNGFNINLSSVPSLKSGMYILNIETYDTILIGRFFVGK